MDELTKLALKARNGNRLSLGSFIRQTQADVWRTCNHLGPPGTADDLTQDVYVRFMNSLPNFRGESSAKTWLLSIARHVSIDAVRSRQRHERLSQLFSRDVAIEEFDYSSELHDILRALDVDQRSAFLLTQVLGLSYAEAADVCDCPIGTIRSRVARARGQLIDALCSDESPVDFVRLK